MTFLNKCDELERPTVAEFFQRAFGSRPARGSDAHQGDLRPSARACVDHDDFGWKPKSLNVIYP